MTVEHGNTPDDVARARAGVRNAGVTSGRRTRRTRSQPWRNFVERYGWRAYALPILVVITFAALLTTDQVRKSKNKVPGRAAAPPTAPANIPLKVDPGTKNAKALAAAALPPGPAYTKKGTGTFRTIPGTTVKIGTGRLYRYSIDVEKGVSAPVAAEFAKLVVTTLSDSRSWAGHGLSLQRAGSGSVDFHVTLTSAMTVRKLCGYTVAVETSCYAQAGNTSNVNRVVINDARWQRGAAAYVGNPDIYRVYMINHENGHALGHAHAHQCLPGGLAPVMMQQTFGLRSATTDKYCQANAWPYPRAVGGAAVPGAPGAEQPDTRANNEYGLAD